MNYTRTFNEIGRHDAAIAGGKGASLGEMTQAGIAVPPGFVVLADAFEYFLRDSGLHEEIDSLLHQVHRHDVCSVQHASEEIQALILSAPIPENLIAEIQEAFKNLDTEFVAVRSSATAEDSTSAAWAGQLESYLNTDETHLIDNIRRCWASLFTPRAITYRFEKDLHEIHISVAVVIQKMIASEVSGIAFSVHPVTEDYNQMIIEAGLGLGEAIVSGQITPDSYIVEKEPRAIRETSVADQERALYRAASGGNEWRAVDGRAQKLTETQILELADLVARIESHYGFPCDIEWAYEDGKFYIVQSRPITTLRDKPSSTLTFDFKLTDYQRLFQWTGGGLPFLISDMFMGHYKTLQGFVVAVDGVWTSFLPRTIVEKTLDDGVDRIGNVEKFLQYKKDFEDFKKACDEFFNSIIKKQEIRKSEMQEALMYFSRLYFYYSKTEFFYVDKAYQLSGENEVIKNNLADFDQIKNGGRVYLNKLYLGDESYIEEVLRILEKQFSVLPQDLRYYGMDDLMNLFDGLILDIGVVRNRKHAYAMIGDGREVIVYEGEAAAAAIRKFLHDPSQQRTSEIKGVIASKGKASGRVKVLDYGYENFNRIHELVAGMAQGDILVADTTAPEIMVACKKAAAILTNQGGLMSHAAIVSREMGIPCLVGLNNITELVKDGDMVEVDAEAGFVHILKSGG